MWMYALYTFYIKRYVVYAICCMWFGLCCMLHMHMHMPRCTCNMYLYMYMYMHVYIYIHIYIYAQVYAYMYVYVYVNIHDYMYVIYAAEIPLLVPLPNLATWHPLQPHRISRSADRFLVAETIPPKKKLQKWEWDETLIWIVGVSKSLLQKTKSNALRFGLSCCPALQALMSTDPHERSPPTFDRPIKGPTVYAWKAQHRVTEVKKKSNMSSCFRSTIPSWMAYCRIFTKLLYLN